MSKVAPVNRVTDGPFDVSEVRVPNNVINFGSLIVTPQEDLTVRLEVEEATGTPLTVTLECANSILQVVAFAASNSDGLWLEVQEQLADSIKGAGGSVSEGRSALGPYLLAELHQENAPVRRVKFVGVDGPRWFLKGTITGAALHDIAASERIDELFRSLIVQRGDAPMPPRETLPLIVPEGTIPPPRTSF
jgi:hypothetical protein